MAPKSRSGARRPRTWLAGECPCRSRVQKGAKPIARRLIPARYTHLVTAPRPHRSEKGLLVGGTCSSAAVTKAVRRLGFFLRQQCRIVLRRPTVGSLWCPLGERSPGATFCVRSCPPSGHSGVRVQPIPPHAEQPLPKPSSLEFARGAGRRVRMGRRRRIGSRLGAKRGGVTYTG